MRNISFKLFIIVILGFLLRTWFIDKPEGLWYDEYLSWDIASQKDWGIFFTNMIRNCHTPFYYLYLKIWMIAFGDTDITLRYSSLIPSIISIPIMYLVGKEFKDKNLGLFCALVTAISSFLIYFAQEVRLYSLIFLFSSLSLYFTIKVFKYSKIKDMVLQFVMCMFLVLTHTLGIIYVFLLILFTIFYVIEKLPEEKRKKTIKKLSVYVLLPITAIIIAISPILYNIATFESLSQYWSDFNLSKILTTFTDYFSPIQSNIINTPDTFKTYIYNNNELNYSFIIFALLPLFIAIYSFYNAFKTQNKKLLYLFLTASIFFAYLCIISLAGKMVLITKYSTEMYPILILTFCFGLYKITNKKLMYILISIFLILNISYITIAPNSAPKRTRPEGHLAVIELLNNSRLKENDTVLFTYYPKERFDRYITKKNTYNFHSVNKFNFNYFIYNNENYKQVIQQGKELYKNNFLEFPNKIIQDFSYYTLQKNMKKGDKIGIIFLDSVSFFSQENINEIVKDKKRYEKTPYIFLVFSQLKNNLLYSFKDDYKIDSITQAGSWTLFVYEKIN